LSLHLKRAVKRRLADTSISKKNNYDSNFAHAQAEFIDANFHPFSMNEVTRTRSDLSDPRFCPKEFRKTFWNDCISFSLHPLIPYSYNNTNEFLSSDGIWLFQFGKCTIKNVWVYMWTNWYQKENWILWARAANPRKLCLFKTTMLIEAH